MKGVILIHIHEIVKQILSSNEPAVLAIIVHVDGSAYRKEGAWMLIRQNQARVGLLSGGCLERDLSIRAERLIGTGKGELVHYDLRAEDDLGWGIGPGCNGIVSIFMRDLDSEFRYNLFHLHEYMQKDEPVLFIQSLSNQNEYVFKQKNGELLGSFTDETPLDHDELLRMSPPFFNYAKMHYNRKPIYKQLLWRQPRLYLFGAGEDARPLAKLATENGYSVQIIDWRPALCTEEFFPTASSLHVGDILSFISTSSFTPLDSVIVMTHSFERDQAILHMLKDYRLLYLGVLGSKQRMARLLKQPHPSFLHSPAGLDIAADGPGEIAVSIVAQLIQTRRKNHRKPNR